MIVCIHQRDATGSEADVVFVDTHKINQHDPNEVVYLNAISAALKDKNKFGKINDFLDIYSKALVKPPLQVYRLVTLWYNW